MKFSILVALLLLVLSFGAAYDARPVAAAGGDILVEVIDTPDPVLANGFLTYTVRVANNSLSPNTGTILSATFDNRTTLFTMQPSFLTFSSGPNNAGFTTNPFDLGPNVFFDLTITLQVNAGVADGTVLSSTFTATNFPDENNSNNSATAVTVVGTQALGADVRITKFNSSPNVRVGGLVIWTVSVINDGPLDALNVVMTDILPPNVTFQSATCTTCNNVTVTTPPVGSSGTITASTPLLLRNTQFGLVISARVVSTAQVGDTAPNTATVTTSSLDINPNNNSAGVTTNVTLPPLSADTSVTKTAHPTSATPGGQITYTIVFANAGPSVAQDATLIDVLPANTTFVSASQISGTAAFTLQSQPAVGGTGNVVFFRLNFSANTNATFQIIVNVNANTPPGTSIDNVATGTARELDTNTANNSSTGSSSTPGGPTPPQPPTGGGIPTGTAPTATPAPIPVQTAPFVPPVIPQVFQNPAAQGIVNGSRNNTPVPASRPQQAVVLSSGVPAGSLVITPPRTGDAGLMP